MTKQEGITVNVNQLLTLHNIREIIIYSKFFYNVLYKYINILKNKLLNIFFLKIELNYLNIH